MTTGREFRLASPGSAMLFALLLVLAVLPLGILAPVVMFADEALAAIIIGMALFVLVPVWALLAYTLLVQRLELTPGIFYLRCGPWKLRVSRQVLEEGSIEVFSPLQDSGSLEDKRISGISIGSIAVGRFRQPNGKWAFKAVFGAGDAIRLTDPSGTHLEFSPQDPQAFVDAWSATGRDNR